MLNGYQKSLVDHLRQIPVSGPPTPWLHLASIPVGGFAAAAFTPDEDHLFVITQSGRGVFELPSGARVGRDHDSSWSWFDFSGLVARTISPVRTDTIAVAGIDGGGLPTVTKEGWKLEVVAPDWPNEFVFLSPPGSSSLDMREGKRTYNLGPSPEGDQVLLYGFSPSRRYFLIATSSEIALFAREATAG